VLVRFPPATASEDEASGYIWRKEFVMEQLSFQKRKAFVKVTDILFVISHILASGSEYCMSIVSRRNLAFVKIAMKINIIFLLVSSEVSFYLSVQQKLLILFITREM